MRQLTILFVVCVSWTWSVSKAVSQDQPAVPLDEWAGVGDNSEASAIELSQRDQRLAKHSIASTYRSGDWSRLLGIVRKSLARRSMEDVLAIDRYLEKGSGTSLSAMVWRSRKRLSQSGAKIPRPIALEAFLM